ncbi:MAG TPA: nitroreductase family protein [Actinomycetota bacterium]|nr:nitroreductase family protein [Actinomycetota bacterium]
MEFTEVVRRRRMVRNYSSKEISQDRLVKVLENARLAPSAGFSQGQSFVVVRDPSVRARIAEIAREPEYVARGFDPWLSRAPVHVVCCVSEKAYRDRYAELDKAATRGAAGDWPVPYWYVDGGCSLMLLLLAAVDEGLAAGFLGLESEGYQRLKDLLGIPLEVSPIGVVTIGLPAPDRRSASVKRGWKSLEAVVHWERWGGLRPPGAGGEEGKPPDGTGT